MLPVLNAISDQQSHPTHNNEAATAHLMDYAVTNPTTMVNFKAIDMVLHIDSDALYISKPGLNGRTGRHYYLSSLPSKPSKFPNIPPPAMDQSTHNE